MKFTTSDGMQDDASSPGTEIGLRLHLLETAELSSVRLGNVPAVSMSNLTADWKGGMFAPAFITCQGLGTIL